MSKIHQWIFITVGPLFAVSVSATPTTAPFTGAALERQALIQAVLDSNAGVDALQAAQEAAIARIEPAGALEDPVLSYDQMPRQLTSGGDLDRSFNVEISQALPWPGKLAARADTVRAESRAAGAEVDILRLRLRELAASAYAEWAFVERAIQINIAHQDLLEQLRSVAAAQYAAGRGGQQDVLQADIEHRLLEERILALKRRRAELRARINGLINREPNAALPLPAGLSEPESPQPFEMLADLARTTHPELTRIEYQIAGRQAQVELAEKEFFPDFRLSAGYNSMWRNPRHRGGFGIAVNIPLDQSKRRATLSAAKADLMESEWRLIDRRAQLLGEIESARAAVVESLRSFKLYRDQLLPLAGDVLDAAVADYTAGRSDFLSIISAERHQLTTALGQARALADYHRRLATLERTVGQPLVRSGNVTGQPTVDSTTVVSQGGRP